jgi:glycosyl transferase, family 25
LSRFARAERRGVTLDRQTPSPPPIYLINLARRPDRLARMTERLTAAGLGFTRIEAIDAREADPAWLAAQFAPAGSFGPISPAEQACALSHFKACEAFLNSPQMAGASHAVILEDDVRLSEHAGDRLSRLDWLAPSTGLLKIERERSDVLLGPARRIAGPDGAFVARLLWDHSGAAGYIVSRAVAEALAAMTPKPALPFDFLLFNPALSPVFRRFKPEQLAPALVAQAAPAGEDSDIEACRAPLTLARTRPCGSAKLRREILRIRDQASRLAAIAFSGGRWTRIAGLSD